jgi:protease-4
MGNVAASGGYYLSAPADLIMAHPTTVTGSIGVIGQLMNVEALAQKIGVQIETFKSGAHKDLGSMTRPMSVEERRIFQELIDAMFGKFLDVVMAGRGSVTLPDRSAFTEAHLRRIADGRIYTADQALANGLVDRIGYREDAIAQARQMAGLAQARVVEYSRQPSVLDLFSARAGGGGVTINLPRTWLESASPRLLYLWTAP